MLGWFADRIISRQAPLLFGLVLLGAATVMLGIGTNVYVLIGSRLLQGLSAAIVYTSGLALLVDTVGHGELGKWMGVVLSFANAGLLVSPFIGGIIYGSAGYNAIFLAMLGMIILDILLRVVMIEKKSAAKWMKSTELEGGNSGTIADSTTHKQDHDRSVNIVDTIVDEGDPLLTTSSRERSHDSIEDYNRTTEPLSKTPTMIILLKRPRVLAALYGVFIAQTLITSFDGVIPLFVKRTFHWDPTRAGLIFLTITGPSLAAPLAGALSDKYGSRRVAACGFIFASPMLALLALVTHHSVSQILLLCAILTILGKLSAAIRPCPDFLPITILLEPSISVLGMCD